MKVPARERLPHDVPLWVDPGKACYFITIYSSRRGIDQLAYERIALDLIETSKHRNAKGIWYVRLAMLMPDHVHLVVWFPDIEKRLQTIVSKWKEWSAKSLKIDRQRDFSNIACGKRKAFAKRPTTFWRIRCEPIL
jgi:putative transposase